MYDFTKIIDRIDYQKIQIYAPGTVARVYSVQKADRILSNLIKKCVDSVFYNYSKGFIDSSGSRLVYRFKWFELVIVLCLKTISVNAKLTNNSQASKDLFPVLLNKFVEKIECRINFKQVSKKVRYEYINNDELIRLFSLFFQENGYEIDIKKWYKRLNYIRYEFDDFIFKAVLSDFDFDFEIVIEGFSIRCESKIIELFDSLENRLSK